MRSTWLTLGVVALAATSCTFDRLPKLGPSLELVAGDTGGAGNLDGAGAAARFRTPFGVAVDPGGNVYLADRLNHTIRKISSAGLVTTLAGTSGIFGSTNAVGAAARFNNPTGVAFDSSTGNLYVADQGNSTIRKIAPTGAVTTLAGTAGPPGYKDGTGADVRFSNPFGVAVDSAGTVYVADTGNNVIRKVTATGDVTTLAGVAGPPGGTDSPNARFAGPTGVAVDGAGNVYVADQLNHTVRKIDPAGMVVTLAGMTLMRGTANGMGGVARFNFPTGVAVDGANNIYITDEGSHTLRQVTPDGIVSTPFGAATIAGATDGPAATARFNLPTGVAVDSTGKIFVTDQGSQIVRKIIVTEGVTTLAGTPGLSGTADGTGADARFVNPTGIAADDAGNIYVADRVNHTVRKITPDGVVTTLAGSAGLSGSANGKGTAARFGLPIGIAVDGGGNIYVADTDNTTVRKVTPDGDVTTLAGSPGVPGDTDATGDAARFRRPFGLTVDDGGNVYVADGGNKSIRKIDAAGAVTTLGRDAGFNDPFGIAVDSAGNIYVADDTNEIVRKVTPDGAMTTTLAGMAGVIGSTDGTGTTARFSLPGGLAVDRAGNIYVADTNNSAIRKVTPDGSVTTIAGVAGSAAIVLGESPRFSFPQHLAIVGDSLVITDNNAILRLRHAVE